MSFHALFLAVQAADVVELPEDEEFGLPHEYVPALDVTWVLYRSAGAGLIFGVLSVAPESSW